MSSFVPFGSRVFTSVAVGTGWAAAATLTVGLLKQWTPAASLGVIYVLAAAGAALGSGLAAGLLTSTLGAMAFNYFHLEPVYTMSVASQADVLALSALFLASVAVTCLAMWARHAARQALLHRAAAERSAQEREQLDRVNQVKSALMRSVSHDLRTPLTGLIAASEGLTPDLTPSDQSELIGVVRTESYRLRDLIEALLDQSRIEADASGLRPSLCSLEEIVTSAVARSRRPADVVVMVEGEPRDLWVDAAEVERAVWNILDNSLRYAAGKPVTVTVSHSRSIAQVTIANSGPPIPQEDQSSLFEPFQGGRTNAPVGTGLGLSIAYGFTIANGGTLTLDSDERATRFTLSFPYAEVLT